MVDPVVTELVMRAFFFGLVVGVVLTALAWFYASFGILLHYSVDELRIRWQHRRANVIRMRSSDYMSELRAEKRESS